MITISFSTDTEMNRMTDEIFEKRKNTLVGRLKHKIVTPAAQDSWLVFFVQPKRRENMTENKERNVRNARK